MAAINRSTDMTTGSIWKRMVSFAVPVFLGNLCQQLYNTVDSVIVGKFVGKQALAAVASSGNLIFMMTGFFMGLFIGAGIVIAQYFGARNYEKVRSAVHTDIAFALCCGVLLTLLGVFFTPTILTWMRTPADVLSTSILYFRLYFLGSRFLVFGVKGMLSAAKNVRNAMLFNVLSFMSDKLLTVGNTVAALDELYIWLSNPTAIEYIRNCLKRVRKKESAMLLASQNLEDFDQEGIREMTKPLFSIPPHQFLFNAGSIDKRSYMEMLQLDEAEYNLIKFPQRGVCLYKCGNERYLLEVHAPAYKEKLFGTAGGR